jgi:hypothetical protein
MRDDTVRARKTRRNCGRIAPKLTASTGKPAPFEKAVAVAARAQLGYDHRGQEIGPGDGKKPRPDRGSL